MSINAKRVALFILLVLWLAAILTPAPIEVTNVRVDGHTKDIVLGQIQVRPNAYPRTCHVWPAEEGKYSATCYYVNSDIGLTLEAGSREALGERVKEYFRERGNIY